jgi:hypothetical protein
VNSPLTETSAKRDATSTPVDSRASLGVGSRLPKKDKRSGAWGRSFTFERALAASLMGIGAACSAATCVVVYLRLTGTWDTLIALRVNSWLLVSEVAITFALGCIVVRRVICCGRAGVTAWPAPSCMRGWSYCSA